LRCHSLSFYARRLGLLLGALFGGTLFGFGGSRSLRGFKFGSRAGLFGLLSSRPFGFQSRLNCGFLGRGKLSCFALCGKTRLLSLFGGNAFCLGCSLQLRLFGSDSLRFTARRPSASRRCSASSRAAASLAWRRSSSILSAASLCSSARRAAASCAVSGASAG